MQGIIKVGNSTKIRHSWYGREYLSSGDHIDFVEVFMEDAAPKGKVEVVRELSDDWIERGAFRVFGSEEEDGLTKVALSGKFEDAEEREPCKKWRRKAKKELTEARDEIDALLNTLNTTRPYADTLRMIDYIETKRKGFQK